MSLFGSSGSSQGMNLKDFIQRYGFAGVSDSATFRDLTVGRTIELLGTLPEIISSAKLALEHFQNGKAVLPQDHLEGRYDYSNTTLDDVINMGLDLTEDNLGCLISDYYLSGRSMPRNVIEILLYNANFVRARELLKTFIYSLECRTDYSNKLDKSKNEDAPIIEWYNDFNELYYNLLIISVDGIVNDDILA